MSDIDQNTYVGLTLRLNEATMSWQRSVCELYNIRPRHELHITIGFLGSVSNDNLSILKGCFQDRDVLNLSVIVLGLGAATNIGTTQKILNEKSDVLNSKKVVVWAAVEPSNEIILFRNELIETCINIGIINSSLTSGFYPHITLGSRCNTNPLYDRHEIEKNTTLECNITAPNIYIEKLHVTTAQIHPNSLFVINEK